MTVKTRVSKLEKEKNIKEPEKITIRIVGEDPTDKEFILVNYGQKDEYRITKAEYEAENKAKEKAGDQVIIISYEKVAQK